MLLTLFVGGENVDGIKKFLSGKKTYIVAATGVLTAAMAWAEGGIDLQGLITAIFAGIAACTVRAGVAKVEQKVS